MYFDSDYHFFFDELLEEDFLDELDRDDEDLELLPELRRLDELRTEERLDEDDELLDLRLGAL